MTKLTKESSIINCSAILQIGIRARPQSVIGAGTFHGAGRQMASEFFRLCVHVSHALTVTTTMTLYKHKALEWAIVRIWNLQYIL